MHMSNEIRRLKTNRSIKIIFTSIILFFILMQMFSISSQFPNGKNVNNKNDSTQNTNALRLADGESESILFQGSEIPLNITDTGKLFETNQEISLTNEEEFNLTYYLDDVNGWEVSKVQSSIEDIQDTRNWANNSDILPINIFKITETVENSDKPYKTNEVWSDIQNIMYSGAIAIRVHFDYIDFEEDNDFVRILNNNSECRYIDTGSRSDFFSPWIKGDELFISIYTDSDQNRGDGYIIDYYEIVNRSSNYNINSDIWGFNEDTQDGGEYGPGYAGNISAMYLAFFSDYAWDGLNFYSRYDKNNFTEFYQNLSIQRGNVIDAYVSFDYFPEFCMESNSLFIYVKINNEKIYSKYFGDMYTAGLNEWYSTGKIYMNLWTNNSNIFDENFNNQNLNISIGLESVSDSYYSGYEDAFQQVIWFDNISLGLTTVANSSQNGINLTISTQNNKYDLLEGGQWGESSLTINENWNENPVSLTINTTSPSLEFVLNTTLFGYHNTTSKINQQNDDGISYKIHNNGTIYWEFLHNFYWAPQYSDFEFVVEKPLNWKILSVLDQGDNLRLFEGGDIGDRYLKINKTQAVFYGWWSFKATSPNFINITNTELLKQGKWLQNTYFTSKESTRIKTQVNYSNEIPPNIENNYVNLTIYHPNGTIWHEEWKKPESNGTVFFSKITFGSLNTTGGYYNYTLFWSNGTSLGGLQSSFLVIHNSSLTLLKPEDAKISHMTHGFVGDIIPLRIFLKDSDMECPISKAELSYNWTGGQQLYFDDDSLGIYEVNIDTSSLSRGLYNIIINSSKIGYINSNLTLQINLGEVTNLQRIESEYYIELHANSTIKFKFSDFSMVGIDGAEVKLNISDERLYSINNTGNGIYIVEFNSSFTDNLGIYQLNINFTAIGYEPQFHVYQFQIVEQSVNFTLFFKSQEIEENSVLEVSFNDIITISAKILAKNDKRYLSGGNITWISQNYEVNLTEVANFWYNTSITCSSSSFSLGLNYVYLQFQMEGYATTNFALQLIVAQIAIDIIPIDFIDSFEANLGEDVSINIQLKESGTNIKIDGAIISYSWEYGVGLFEQTGPGVYELELEIPEDLEEDNYKITLIISKPGEVYKTTQYSFVLDITEEEQEEDNSIFWILLAILLSVIGVLSTLSYRSYVYLPRRRRKRKILLAKTQKYKDIKNIQAVVVIHKFSGIPVYLQSYSILERNQKELFSGFIQAITSIGKEISGEESKIVDHDSGKTKKVIELDFKHFFCLIVDKEIVRIVLILKEKASDRLKSQVWRLISEVYSNLGPLFTDWDGELGGFEKAIPLILNEHFELYYKESFTLTLSALRKANIENQMEKKIIDVIRTLSKKRIEFYLDSVIAHVKEENKDLVIKAIESLIQRKIIVPTNN